MLADIFIEKERKAWIGEKINEIKNTLKKSK